VGLSGGLKWIRHFVFQHFRLRHLAPGGRGERERERAREFAARARWRRRRALLVRFAATWLPAWRGRGSIGICKFLSGVPNGACKTCHIFQISLGVSLTQSCPTLAGEAIKKWKYLFFLPLSSPGLKLYISHNYVGPFNLHFSIFWKVFVSKCKKCLFLFAPISKEVIFGLRKYRDIILSKHGLLVILKMVLCVNIVKKEFYHWLNYLVDWITLLRAQVKKSQHKKVIFLRNFKMGLTNCPSKNGIKIKIHMYIHRTEYHKTSLYAAKTIFHIFFSK
jgi:hypothetical protein